MGLMEMMDARHYLATSGQLLREAGCLDFGPTTPGYIATMPLDVEAKIVAKHTHWDGYVRMYGGEARLRESIRKQWNPENVPWEAGLVLTIYTRPQAVESAKRNASIRSDGRAVFTTRADAMAVLAMCPTERISGTTYPKNNIDGVPFQTPEEIEAGRIAAEKYLERQNSALGENPLGENWRNLQYGE